MKLRVLDADLNKLFAPCVAGTESDAAVRRINRRLGRRLTRRVTFAAWTAELGIVRGPHPVAA